MNNFRLVTITHKTANIDHIGRYIPTVNNNPTEIAAVLKMLKAELQLEELYYLATCNRLTIFFIKDVELNNAFIVHLFSLLNPEMPNHCLEGILDIIATYKGEACVQHLFEVASSLDSLVIGEREILPQLRQAYEFCKEHDLCGDDTRLIFKMAIPAAKNVFLQTRISRNPVSVVSLAMRQLMENPPPLNARFLVIGAGVTNSQVLKILYKSGYKNFTVYNRSLHKAEDVAEKFGSTGKALPLSELVNHTDGFDVLISCITANKPVVDISLYNHLLTNDIDAQATKIIVDLAVPNNVDSNLQRYFPIRYIAVEQLRVLAAENLQKRKQELHHAVQLINNSISEFKLAYLQRLTEKSLAHIPNEVRSIKNRALDQVFAHHLKDLSPEARSIVMEMANYMEKKYVAIPMKAAKVAIAKQYKSLQNMDKQLNDAVHVEARAECPIGSIIDRLEAELPMLSI